MSEALAAVSSEEFADVGRVTASAGVADFRCTMNDDQLYRLADSKLYEAKTSRPQQGLLISIVAEEVLDGAAACSFDAGQFRSSFS